jgi:hypothetical protein
MTEKIKRYFEQTGMNSQPMPGMEYHMVDRRPLQIPAPLEGEERLSNGLAESQIRFMADIIRQNRQIRMEQERITPLSMEVFPRPSSLPGQIEYRQEL